MTNTNLFNLLKEPLKLHDTCIEFTLEYSLEKTPIVREVYLVEDVPNVINRVVRDEYYD